MSIFFRKIRRDLIVKSQFFRYIKYAFGETILVVLGILIALYINNWNNQRINELDLITKLEQVEDELIGNIEFWDRQIEMVRRRDSVLLNIIHKKYTKSDYQNNRVLHVATKWAIGGRMRRSSYENFIASYKSPGTKMDSIKFDLDALYSSAERDINADSRRLLESVDNYIDELVRTKPWYGTDALGDYNNESAIDYYLNDPLYRNRVLRYHNLWYFNLGRRIQFYRNQALVNYIKVHKYLNEINPAKADSLMFTYNPEDFKHYVGIYKDSLGAIEISIDNDELMFRTNPAYGPSQTSKIIPVNRWYFWDSNWRGFNYLIFDENNEVEALQWWHYKHLENGVELKKVKTLDTVASGDQ